MELLNAIADRESLLVQSRQPAAFIENASISDFRRFRRAADMTLRDLADQIGMSDSVLSKIENGIITKGKPFDKVKKYWEDFQSK